MKDKLLILFLLVLMLIGGVFIGIGLKSSQVKHISSTPGSPGIMTKRVQVKGIDYVCSCQLWGKFREDKIKKPPIKNGALRNIIRECIK